MTARPLALGFLFAAFAQAQEAPRAVQIAEPPDQAKPPGLERVISSSEQFRVSGGDPLLRATVANLAEETKEELLRLTEEKEQQRLSGGKLPDEKAIARKIPVNITLRGKTGDPMPLRTVRMELLYSEAGYDLRMDVHLSRGIEQEGFKSAVTRALIYERTLRNRSAEDNDRPLKVAPWLVDGLREASDWRLNRSDRRLYEALFKTGGLFKMDELLAISENNFEDLDGATRAAFRVSSGALVMALLEQPQGKEGFRSFIGEVAGFEGEMPTLLRKHFPELNLSETSLAKWWALQLASKGGLNPLTDILSINQTETSLGAALRLDFRTAEGAIQQKEISAWPELAALNEPERIAAVRSAQDALVRLSYRCFPSYRPLIAEYQLILTAVAKGRTADVAARLQALGDTRTTMVAKAVRARDYMNWFEITRARETSGVFDDYLRLKERLKANPRIRTDGPSLYLDKMEKIFHREDAPDPATPPR